jgi:hypothetical protein
VIDLVSVLQKSLEETGGEKESDNQVGKKAEATCEESGVAVAAVYDRRASRANLISALIERRYRRSDFLDTAAPNRPA